MSAKSTSVAVKEEFHTAAFKMFSHLARLVKESANELNEMSQDCREQLMAQDGSEQKIRAITNRLEIQDEINQFLHQLTVDSNIHQTASQMYSKIIELNEARKWEKFPKAEKEILLKVLFHIDNIIVFNNVYSKVLSDTKLPRSPAAILEDQLRSLFHYGNETPQLRERIGETSNKILFECICRVEQIERQSDHDLSSKQQDPISSFLSKMQKQQETPLTTEWLSSVILANANLSEEDEDKIRYFDHNANRTAEGQKRLEHLLKQVDKSSNERLYQEDLALLSQFFGRKLLKRAMQRYAIHGDGSDERPLNMNNLRQMLIAMASIYRPKDIKAADPQLGEFLRQLVVKVATNDGFASIESIEHFKNLFEKQTQNPAAKNLNSNIGFRLFLKGREIKKLVLEYVIDRTIALLNIFNSKRFEKVGTQLLSLIEEENQALDMLVKDLEFLEIQNKVENYVKDANSEEVPPFVAPILEDLGTLQYRAFTKKYPELNLGRLTSKEKLLFSQYHQVVRSGDIEAINALQAKLTPIIIDKVDQNYFLKQPVLEDLQSLSKARFINKYPGFSKDYLTETEQAVLEEYFKARRTKNEDRKAQAFDNMEEMIDRRLDDLMQFSRIEFLGHLLNYADQYSRNDHPVRIPDRDGRGRTYTVTSVVPDVEGLAMAMYTPTQAPEDEMQPIPLVINFAGTHDVASGLRDLDPNGAGTQQFNPEGPYLYQMIEAVNNQIAMLTEKYPGRKVSIELYGHSLGGADVYNFEMALLEAMAQNKYQTSTGKNQFNALMRKTNSRGFYGAKDKALRENLPTALEAALGLKPRALEPGFTENRKHPEDKISHLSLNNIACISSNTANSAGIHKNVGFGLHAVAAFLSRGTEFFVEDNTLLVDGDFVPQTGHTRGFASAAPNEAFFKDAIYVRSAKLAAGFAGMRQIMLHAIDARCAPLLAHVKRHFEDREGWLKLKVKINSNFNELEFQELKEELNKRIELIRHAFVDMRAYIAIKHALYTGTQYGYQLAQPLIQLWTFFMALLSVPIDNLSQAMGYEPGKPKENLVDIKEILKPLIEEKAHSIIHMAPSEFYRRPPEDEGSPDDSGPGNGPKP